MILFSDLCGFVKPSESDIQCPPLTQFGGKARYDRSQEQLFAVNITLTPEGDLHREEVLALLFESVGHSGLRLHHGEPW